MLITLRLIHILAGAFWAGTAIFTVAFLIPTIRALGPAGGPVMQHITQVRKLPLYFLGAGILTLISGIGLYSRASAGFSNAWMRSGQGTTFGIGAVLAGAGRPPSPEQQAEMQRLQARMGKTSLVTTTLLVGATAAMAVARYIS